MSGFALTRNNGSWDVIEVEDPQQGVYRTRGEAEAAVATVTTLPSTDVDEDLDKGEMVFVYRSDLQEFLTWYAAKGVDESDMNPRQTEALEALWADSEA